MWPFIVVSCVDDSPSTAEDSIGTTGETATTGGETPHSALNGPHTDDTGDTSQSAHTGLGHSGAAATADTAADPPLLPSCDIGAFAPSQLQPASLGLEELRSGRVLGDPGGVGVNTGQGTAVLSLAGGQRVLVLNWYGSAFFFAGPVVGDVALGDRLWDVDYSYDHWAKGDLTGDGGDDLADGEQTLSPPFDPAQQLPPPAEPGSYRASDVSSSDMEGWYSPSSNVEVGNWDGSGKADLLFSWDSGAPGNGIIPRQPQAPYPFGGAAVYVGPLARHIRALGADAPDAWYDVSAFEVVLGLPWSGGMSIFVDDVDGDGLDEVLVDGRGWGNIAARDTVEPPGYNQGGMALFSGGRPGLNALGDERLLLAATCDSDTWCSRSSRPDPIPRGISTATGVATPCSPPMT